MTPNCCWKHRFSILLFILTGLAFELGAQTLNQRFTIVHLPRLTNYSKVKLNQEIAQSKDKEEVQKIIQSKNFPATTIIIGIREDKGIQWWNYRTSSKVSSKAMSQLIQFRSKAFMTLSVKNLYDFKSLIKDTLAIIDSLEVEYEVSDAKYTPEGFLLATNCDSNVISIPSRNGKLVFSPSYMPDCARRLTYVSISHKNNTGRQLATGKLHFLSEEDKEMLLEMARLELSQDPAIPVKNIAERVGNAVEPSIGTLYYPQLVDWLTQNLSK